MSHIVTIQTKVKIESEAHLCRALNAVKKVYPELTYEKSKDGNTIQVHMPALDNPVRNYHPEGNLRYTKNKDGSWTPAGDSYNCRDVYKSVTDELNQRYTATGCDSFATLNNYTTAETHDKDGNLVLTLTEW
jgi:hypothetical protein